jgi:two-component system response regulator YesN
MKGERQICLPDLIRRHVRETIEQSCRVEEVARHFYYHPKYLSQLFKKESGQPLSEFIASVRMERAKELLRHTDRPVEAIALQLGFSSSQHFYKRFRQQFGTTPIRYRNQLRG